VAAVRDIKGAGAEDPRGRGQAPRIPLALAAAYERTVLDEASPRFVRMHAWFRLIKVWGTLRFDDHRGLVPNTMSLRSDGLHGTLVRTKTSGLRKSKQLLPLFVAKGAALLSPESLAEG
jgi:hypothetical protein